MNNIQDLVDAIRQVMPEVVDEWNTTKLEQFEQLFGQSFENFFQGKQTQEKTKLIAPIIDSVFARRVQTRLPNFLLAEGKGQDYMFNHVPIESKITFGQGDSWTGNGYAKTPWHLLMRFELLNTGEMTHHFAMITDLAACQSQWTAPGTTSNFSTLRFSIQDFDNLIPITGTISNLTQTGRNGKYVRAILTEA
jgi:hypothetical protein